MSVPRFSLFRQPDFFGPFSGDLFYLARPLAFNAPTKYLTNNLMINNLTEGKSQMSDFPPLFASLYISFGTRYNFLRKSGVFKLNLTLFRFFLVLGRTTTTS
jgi:hypothetical protein